jgi:hypothetical protein
LIDSPYPSTSDSGNSSTDPEKDKSREAHRKILYRGLWNRLVREIRAHAELPEKLSYSRWAAALYRFVPKEGDNLGTLYQLMNDLEKEGKDNPLLKRVVQELKKF